MPKHLLARAGDSCYCELVVSQLHSAVGEDLEGELVCGDIDEIGFVCRLVFDMKDVVRNAEAFSRVK